MFKKNEIDLTTPSFYKKIIVFAIPLFLSAALQLFYNAADLIVCGLFGSPHSTAAISSTYSTSGLLVQFAIGLSMGVNAVMSRHYGAGDKVKGQKTVYSSMIASIVFGLIILGLGLTFSRQMLELLNTPEEVIDLSQTYVFTFFFSVPFSLLFNFGAALFRAVGDSRRPFFFLLISGIVNIGLNCIFVILFKMDVFGVALATVISQALSSILMIGALLRYNGFFNFKIKEMRFYNSEFFDIMKIGLPSGLQNSIFSISNLILQSSVNSLGVDVVGGNGAAGSIEGFILESLGCFGQSCMVFVSANYGAKKNENINKVIYICLFYQVMANLFMGSIALGLGKQLIWLYVKNPDAIEAGYQKMWAMVPFYWIWGIMQTYAFAMRGIKHSLTPMLVTVLSIVGVRIIWIYLVFPIEQMHNIFSIGLSYPISWAVTAILNTIFYYYYKGHLVFEGEEIKENEIEESS